MNTNSEPTISLREFFERVLAERDARYQAMFDSAKDAVNKADTALREYKASANEFRLTLSDQAKTLVPRTEYEGTIKELRAMNEAQAKLIVSLQLGESRGEGGTSATAASKSTSQWLIGLSVVIGLSILGGLGSLLFFLLTRTHP